MRTLLPQPSARGQRKRPAKAPRGSQPTHRRSQARGNTGYAYNAAGNPTTVDYSSRTTDLGFPHDARP